MVAFDYTIFLFLFLLTLFTAYFLQNKKTSQPHFRYFSLSLLQQLKAHTITPSLPVICIYLSLSFFCIAMANPRYYTSLLSPQENKHEEGIAIYLAIDRSGSMNQEMIAYDKFGVRQNVTKMALTKRVSQRFVQDRPHDLIGLTAFARATEILVPLTLDHSLVNQKIEEITTVEDPKNDGTAIGYAIYITTSLIAATEAYAKSLPKGEASAYAIKSAILILVTDGLQDPNPLDQGDQFRTLGLEEAAEYAKEQGVKLYLINVDPKISLERFAPNRQQLEEITKKTGGKFYLMTDNFSLEEIYGEINQLETTAISKSVPTTKQEHSFSPVFLSIGLFFLLSAICLETFIIRKTP